MKTMQDLKNDFNKATRSFVESNKQVPRKIGILGVKLAKENFKKQGFNGKNWRERSAATNEMYDKRGSFKGSVYSSKNPILVQTDKLKDSITYRFLKNWINIGVDLRKVPYAKKHNEGGSAKFRGKWVRIPKRQFLGYTNQYRNEILTILRQATKDGFSKFRLA